MAQESGSTPSGDQTPASESGPLSQAPPRMTPLRELQLVEAHRDGHADAMGELLQAYQPRIYAVCYRMLGNPEEARDITQDTMVRVIEGLDSYDGRAQLSTWVIRVTMNCCLSHLRRERLRRHKPLAVAPEPQSRDRIGSGLEPEPGAGVEQAEASIQVHEVLAELEPQTRGLLILRDIQELSYQQLSEVLEVPLGTVKSRVYRARLAFRHAYETKWGEQSHKNKASGSGQEAS